MPRKLYDSTLKNAVLRFVEDLVRASEIAKAVEFTVTINKESAPTVSYKVDEIPLMLEKNELDGENE